jgi:molybdenum cofactor biosynthesis protein A
MPAEGVRLTADSLLLSDDEIVRVASVFVTQGVDKIRLTGGEPLVRPNVVSLCARLKALGVRDLAVTTNGLLLKRQLEPLRDAGVNLLNISLDTLVPSKFELIARRRGFETVYESVLRAAALPGLERVKVNCVVKRGVNDDELVDFVRLTERLSVEVRFIEYMPFEGNKWNSASLLPYYEMVDMVRKELPSLSRQRSLDGLNTVSKTWQVPGWLGTVGFISSMSDHFCGSCNRLRLTADGNLKACLFGSEEFSLRDVLRSGATDAELVDKICGTVRRKHAKLGGHDSPESISRGSNRPMILIGG